MPVFANPFGLLTLLGIPAVLVIHFLQRKAKELPISTLFLLDHTRRKAAGGKRFERLLPSIPLWMQLLAVLLLAWFLAEPRYAKSGSIQRIAVVMDSSASMTIFKNEAYNQLSAVLPSLQGPATSLQLTVLESAPNRPRLFTGTGIEEFKKTIEDWQPRDGPTDPTQALRLARSLVSRDGVVLYLTDTPVQSLPFEAKLLSVGTPVENVGFTGVSFTTEQGAHVWRAMVKNHGTHAADRTWHILTDTGSTEPRPLHLEPGALVTLQSAFPVDSAHVRIVLSSDPFPLDDVLPLVLPKPKLLFVHRTSSPAFTDLVDKLTRSLDAAQAAPDANSADLTFASYNPLDPVMPMGNSVVFIEDETRTGAWLKGGIVAEPHPLMDGLNWQPLLARETICFEQRATDSVLLWQDKRPLVLLREEKSSHQLLINFDPTLSNADKQPAFIVLLHRFVETLRAAKVAAVSENLETGQALHITTKPNVPLVVKATSPDGKPLAHSDAGHASNEPGFYTLQQGDENLLTAAVHFGDPREADLSACAATALSDGEGKSSIDHNTRPDPLWRVWLLMLLTALLISWRFTSRTPQLA